MAVKRIDQKRRESYKLFLFILPCLIFIFIFSYLPLRGWIYAFTNYKPGYQWKVMDWVGFSNFTKLFGNAVMRQTMFQVIGNTLYYAILGVILSPVPMFFAIFLNEMSSSKCRKIVQTLTTLPHFISWVIMYSLVFFMLSPNGFVNTLLMNLGLISEPTDVLASGDHVMLTQRLYQLWKETGWNAIVYLAAIAGIDQEQYEAAMIDGANRFQKIWYITVPSLSSTYFVLLVMSFGNFLNTGFDQFYVFQNAFNKEQIQVLDLYVYNLGIGSGQTSMATAVGMAKSIIALVLFTLANLLSKKVRGTSVF